MKNHKKKIKLLLVFVCVLIFILGYYFFYEISTWYDVPLGITFHIVFGSTLMALSGIYIGYTIKYLFFTKKRKRTKRTYLDKKTEDNSK